MWFLNVLQITGANLMTFIKWLGDFVRDSKTGKPSVKRFGLALSVTVICGIMFGMGASIAIIAIEASESAKPEIIRTICNTLENLAYAVLTAVTTGYLVDRTQERKMKSDATDNQQQVN